MEFWHYGPFITFQLLSHVQLFLTPWTAAHQASLSLTISQNLPKFVSIEPVMPSNHFIYCHPLLLLPSIFLRIRSFSSERLSNVRLFATLWTVTCQAPLPMKFSRQEHWSGLSFLSLGESSKPRATKDVLWTFMRIKNKVMAKMFGSKKRRGKETVSVYNVTQKWNLRSALGLPCVSKEHDKDIVCVTQTYAWVLPEKVPSRLSS